MQVFRTISSIVLTFMVLVSSTSFMVGVHLCKDKIQSIALFEKADACEKEKNLPACHRHIKNPCCEDETIIHEGNDFKASVEHIQLNTITPIDIDQPLILISEIIPAAPAARTEYYNYDPPLRSSNVTIEQQVFLI